MAKNKISRPENVIRHQLDRNGKFPNNPQLPLVIYKSVLQLGNDEPASFVEDLLNQNNWKNSWRNGVHHFHHFHSNTHEVLAVYSGTSQVMFGGPDGKIEDLEKGDVVILPAGMSHKRIEADGDFACVGAYPSGKSFDMHKGEDGNIDKLNENIRQVPLPESDPVFGAGGLLFDYWKY
ncbi:MAG: cupin domain-containing protein [Bacteroidales bacterium]